MLDWKLLAATFTAVLLAELGDKTQIATFAAAAGAREARLSVFLGSAGALVVCSALAVLAGAFLGKHVSPVWLERVGGVVLLAMGAWFLVRSFTGGTL